MLMQRRKRDKDGNFNVTSGDANKCDELGLGMNDDELDKKQAQENTEKPGNLEAEALEPPPKKRCTEVSQLNGGNLPKKVYNKSVDKLLEEELAELGDKSKRHFSRLDSGCDGVIFIQIMTLASTKKHVSRFLLRVLPVEVTCYTSGDEIKPAIKPLIEKYFPVETPLIYDARVQIPALIE